MRKTCFKNHWDEVENASRANFFLNLLEGHMVDECVDAGFKILEYFKLDMLFFE